MSQVLSRLSRHPGASETSSSVVRPLALVRDILISAVWFGLVTGLIEGTGLWVLQRLDWLAGPYARLGSSFEIVWISTLFDLLLF